MLTNINVARSLSETMSCAAPPQALVLPRFGGKPHLDPALHRESRYFVEGPVVHREG